MGDAAATPEHFDVLIVGASMSGINAAYNLTSQRPDSFVVLEGKSGFGGTWRGHRYPACARTRTFILTPSALSPGAGPLTRGATG